MNVGLIGLGNMGRGLGKNLLEHEFPLTVYDRSEKAVQAVVDRGASSANSIADIAHATDVIVTCLPSLESIRDVYLANDGIAANAAPGKIAVDCSTSTPALTRKIGIHLTDAGIAFVDAPMLKTAKAAWDGTLHLAVGGDAATIELIRPVLKAVCEKIIVAGSLGAGHALKLINNAMTLGTHVVVCEALTVAQKLNVDLELVLEVGDASMASSNKLRELAPRLINDDHSMAFATDVALKDMSAYTQMAAQADATIPAGEAARDLLRRTSEAGFGDKNVSHVASVLANSN